MIGKMTHVELMTIEAMIAVDPRIGELLSEANIPTDLEYWHRYSHYKALLSEHVGDYATVAALRSPACYERVLCALVAALPGDKESEAQS